MVDQRQAMNNGAGRPRAVGYIRADDDERTTHMTAETQRDEIRETCERRGWALVGTYEDNGALNERPALRQLMVDARNRGFDVVVTYSADRLSRADTTLPPTIRSLVGLGIEIHSLTEGEITLIENGELWSTFGALLAEAHRKLLSEHVRRGIRSRRSKGIHWGPLPIGYQRCDASCPAHDADHTYCHPDPNQARYVREAFDRYAAGRHTLTAAAGWLNECGFRTNGGNIFTARSVGDMLANPFYAGFIRDPDVPRGVRPGIHRALIDECLYRTVQQRLQTSRRPHMAAVRRRRRKHAARAA